MSGGNIQFRCRRCGVVDNAVHAPDVTMAIVDLVVHGRVRGDGVPVNLTHSHSCKDGGLGISDCIGAVPDGPHTKPPLLADGWTLLSWTRSEEYREWRLCAASEEHRMIGWWHLSDAGRWSREYTSSDVDSSNLPDTLWPPPLREGP